MMLAVKALILLKAIIERYSRRILMKKIYSENNFKKFKKYISYLIFGILTTLINYLTYSVFVLMGFYYLMSNLLAFAVSVIFAYITNKKWVFADSEYSNLSIKEFLKFTGSRVFTLLLESSFLFLFIDLLHYNIFKVKVVTTIFVVLVNYLLSEFYIFKKGRDS